MSTNLVLTRVYRRAAISFFGLTVILLFIVAYSVLPRAIVVVTSEKSSVVRSYIFTVHPDIESASDNQNLLGGFSDAEIIQEKTFSATGSNSVAKDLKGSIVVHNNYTRDQVLVATTRFLTSDGVLLRLKENVVVPAGEKISAEVYLDEQHQVSVISEGQLTIPGLWEGLRDKIYGEVTEPLTGEVFKITVANENDFQLAMEDFRASVEDVAKDLLKQKFFLSQRFPPEDAQSMELAALRIASEEWESDHEVGKPAERFKLTGRFTVEGVFLQVAEVLEKMENRIVESLPENQRLVGLTIENLTTSINTYSAPDSIGDVIISWHGKSVPIAVENLVKKELLGGLSKEEAVQKLEVLPEVERARIELTPFWVTRVPKDNVDVIVVQD